MEPHRSLTTPTHTRSLCLCLVSFANNLSLSPTNAIQMGKAAPAVATPSPGLLDLAIDILLFQGDFSWFYWVAIFGYCFNASRFLKETNSSIGFVHGFVLLVLTGFGGSMATGWVCGMPMSIVVNESLPTAMLIAWTLVSKVPGLFTLLSSPAPIRMVWVTLWELMRAHVCMICAGQGGQWLAGKVAPFIPPSHHLVL